MISWKRANDYGCRYVFYSVQQIASFYRLSHGLLDGHHSSCDVQELSITALDSHGFAALSPAILFFPPFSLVYMQFITTWFSPHRMSKLPPLTRRLWRLLQCRLYVHESWLYTSFLVRSEWVSNLFHCMNISYQTSPSTRTLNLVWRRTFTS